jgi:3-isopropylmalate/(R)-2-methylmalate dehydratase small subunit
LYCLGAAPAGEGEIDLEEQEVRFAGRAVAFAIDHEIRRRLLAGLDDIGVTFGQDAAIAAFESERERSGVAAGAQTTAL